MLQKKCANFIYIYSIDISVEYHKTIFSTYATGNVAKISIFTTDLDKQTQFLQQLLQHMLDLRHNLKNEYSITVKQKV